MCYIWDMEGKPGRTFGGREANSSRCRRLTCQKALFRWTSGPTSGRENGTAWKKTCSHQGTRHSTKGVRREWETLPGSYAAANDTNGEQRLQSEPATEECSGNN